MPAVMALLGEYTWWAPQVIKKGVKWLGVMETMEAPHTVEEESCEDTVEAPASSFA